MVDRVMPRVQEILFPILREELPGVTITSWIPDINKRNLPLVNIRRIGGLAKRVDRLDMPVIEIAAFTRDGLEATEDLYLDTRQVIYDHVRKQTLSTPFGYIHSCRETTGMTQVASSMDDVWRVQGLIQLGLCPPKH